MCIRDRIGVDLDTFVPMPNVDGKSTNGGYCGPAVKPIALNMLKNCAQDKHCLLYTSDAADERSSVDLGGRRIIKKKKQAKTDMVLTDK